MLVERCRFIRFEPSCINCIAFQTDKAHAAADVRVAVSRGNGDVEIWNVTNDWHVERVLPGGDGISVEAMVWTANRLFSAGLHSMVTEWNTAKLSAEASVDSFGGAVWTLALSHSKTELAAGCEDGCIKLLDISDGGLVYVRSFDKQAGRILSLAWHPDDSAIASGGSDSTIRVWNSASGRSRLRISVQDESKGDTLVWGVAVLPDLTIVSADSRGRTQLWNGQFGTLVQSFTEHEADVLCLAVALDGKSVYSSGVDNKIIRLRKVDGADATSPSQWVMAGRTRDHTHDVRALAVGPDGKLISGGVDTNLIVYEPEHGLFGKSGGGYRKLPPFPQRPILYHAPGAHILAHQMPGKLQLWRLGSASCASSAGAPTDAEGFTAMDEDCEDDDSQGASDNSDEEAPTVAAAVQRYSGFPTGHDVPIGKPPTLLAELVPRTADNLVCSAIAGDGTMVAYSSAAGTRVFTCAISVDGITVTRMKRLPEDLLPAHAMIFSPDGSKLIIATFDGRIQVLDLASRTLLATLAPPPLSSGETASACMIAVSSDAQWVAVTDGPAIHIYNLDTLRFHGALPRLGVQHTAIGFIPNSATLVVVGVGNQIFTLDCEAREFTAWSRDHSGSLPKWWLERQEKIVSLTFNPAEPDAVYLHDHSGFCVVYFSRAIPADDDRIEFAPGRKQTSQVGGGTNNFRIVKRFQPLLFLGFSGPDALVVVERPWLSVMQELPPPLYRNKYGV